MSHAKRRKNAAHQRKLGGPSRKNNKAQKGRKRKDCSIANSKRTPRNALLVSNG